MSLDEVYGEKMVESILNVYLFVVRIVHRKLRVNRNNEFVDIVEKFVGATMGKNYDFSLTDFIFERSSSADKDHKSYFCSSLVAKLYKKLGLLP